MDQTKGETPLTGKFRFRTNFFKKVILQIEKVERVYSGFGCYNNAYFWVDAKVEDLLELNLPKTLKELIHHD